jgi:hypothetical protein
MKMLLVLFPLVLVSALASTAQALQSLKSLDVPVCHDINGSPVRRTVISDTSKGPAYSTVDYDGAPAIYVNWTEMKKYATSVDTMRFIMEHECGHCALGHIYNNVSLKKTNQQELQADCYAAKQAKALGINIQSVLKDVDILPRDPAHPAGPVRAKNIESCYNQ